MRQCEIHPQGCQCKIEEGAVQRLMSDSHSADSVFAYVLFDVRERPFVVIYIGGD